MPKVLTMCHAAEARRSRLSTPRLPAGTTNHPDHIDPRVLRGGRFSEKIEIGLPGPKSRERLLSKYLDGVALGADAGIPALADRLRDLSPADLEAISNAARRFAFSRVDLGLRLTHGHESHKRRRPRGSGDPCPVDSRLRGNDVTFQGAPEATELPPLILADFEKAVQRVRGKVTEGLAQRMDSRRVIQA